MRPSSARRPGEQHPRAGVLVERRVGADVADELAAHRPLPGQRVEVVPDVEASLAQHQPVEVVAESREVGEVDRRGERAVHGHPDDAGEVGDRRLDPLTHLGGACRAGDVDRDLVHPPARDVVAGALDGAVRRRR